MPHQDFDVLNVAEMQEPESDPVTFGLAGYTFHVLPRIPAGAAAVLGQYNWSTTAAVKLLRASIVAEEEETFDLVIGSKDLIVQAQVLLDIADFVLKAKAGRPLATSSDSSNGDGPTGTGSTET